MVKKEINRFMINISERKEILKSFQKEYKILFNVMAIKQQKVNKFENILISSKGIILLHCFNYEGTLEGSISAEKWIFHKSELNGIYNMIINNPISFLEFQKENLTSFLSYHNINCPIYDILYIPNIHNNVVGIISSEKELKEAIELSNIESSFLSDENISSIINSFYSYFTFNGDDLLKLSVILRENIYDFANLEHRNNLFKSLQDNIHVMNNLVIKSINGYMKFDTLIISQKGLFFIIYNKHKGLIRGNAKDKYWDCCKVCLKSLKIKSSILNQLNTCLIQKEMLRRELKKVNISCEIYGCIYMPTALLEFKDEHVIYTEKELIQQFINFNNNLSNELSKKEVYSISKLLLK